LSVIIECQPVPVVVRARAFHRKISDDLRDVAHPRWYVCAAADDRWHCWESLGAL